MNHTTTILALLLSSTTALATPGDGSRGSSGRIFGSESGVSDRTDEVESRRAAYLGSISEADVALDYCEAGYDGLEGTECFGRDAMSPEFAITHCVTVGGSSTCCTFMITYSCQAYSGGEFYWEEQSRRQIGDCVIVASAPEEEGDDEDETPEEEADSELD